MDQTVKGYADKGDLTSLKYIFAGALDADPTFVKYEEEYEYCKGRGLLEPHIELTPFVSDPTQWDEDYWANLKMDLTENFSDCRMTHMREVAKVFLADKIRRIEAERAQRRQQVQRSPEPVRRDPELDRRDPEPVQWGSESDQQDPESDSLSREEEQAQQLAEARRRLAIENRRARAAERAQARQLAEERRRLAEQESGGGSRTSDQSSRRETGGAPKKAMGTAILVLIVVLILVLLLLKLGSPQSP